MQVEHFSTISHLKNVIFNIADFNARVFPTRSVGQQSFEP